MPRGSHDLDGAVLGLPVVTVPVGQLRRMTLPCTTLGNGCRVGTVCFFPSLAFQGSEQKLLQIGFYDPGPWEPSRSRRRQEERCGLVGE